MFIVILKVTIKMTKDHVEKEEGNQWVPHKSSIKYRKSVVFIRLLMEELRNNIYIIAE